ncbi:sodium-dependent phosphate transporter, partial [Clostridium botulinum]|nr:sodium-dependent phosphate transporter [Clostridium botulinum]
FTGMGIMSASMKPLTSAPLFSDFIVSIGNNWFIGVIAGAAITGVSKSLLSMYLGPFFSISSSPGINLFISTIIYLLSGNN